MFIGTQDNGVTYVNHREIAFPYAYMREGLASLYSDGWYQSANCSTCGGPFPAIADANYLGENNDGEMPETAYLHDQMARGHGTFPRWSDNTLVAFERVDDREGNPSNPSTQVVMFVRDE
jgi:hypothetical protein